ncbi:MAG: sorbosone dehydrogenase family protein [Halobacteriaceae archaeon]
MDTPTPADTDDEADERRTTTRRRFLAATAGGLSLSGVAGCSSRRDQARSTTSTDAPTSTTATTTTTGAVPPGNETETTEAPPEPYFEQGPTVGLETVAEGLVLPNVFAVANEAADRRFVGDQLGRVYVHGPDGLRDEPFLDIADRVVEVGSGLPNWVSEDERGFLGLAFHPEFEENRRFFVRYSTPPDPGETDLDHREILAEYRATPDLAAGDPESERVLLDLPWPRPIHQAGALSFGPDGYLYAAFGDGLNPYNGQDVTNNFKGSILRLDVDQNVDVDAADGQAYGVPEDNPLVGREGRDEHWAWGLRNPWQMAFDGDRLIAGDVGQALYEEVDVIRKGANYGWPLREGLHCHDPDHPNDPPETCPSTSERGEELVDPVVEFPHFYQEHNVGFAVIGGNVYRGSAVPALEGEYLFGAFTASFTTPSGKLVAATPRASGQWPTREIRFAGRENGDLGINLLCIGRDDAGEIYLLGTAASISEKMHTRQKGVVYRLTGA